MYILVFKSIEGGVQFSHPHRNDDDLDDLIAELKKLGYTIVGLSMISDDYLNLLFKYRLGI